MKTTYTYLPEASMASAVFRSYSAPVLQPEHCPGIAYMLINPDFITSFRSTLLYINGDFKFFRTMLFRNLAVLKDNFIFVTNQSRQCCSSRPAANNGYIVHSLLLPITCSAR